MDRRLGSKNKNCLHAVVGERDWHEYGENGLNETNFVRRNDEASETRTVGVLSCVGNCMSESMVMEYVGGEQLNKEGKVEIAQWEVRG